MTPYSTQHNHRLSRQNRVIGMMLVIYFFFSSRRRHTRYWRDWSSRRVLFRSLPGLALPGSGSSNAAAAAAVQLFAERAQQAAHDFRVTDANRDEIGRASCRERV